MLSSILQLFSLDGMDKIQSLTLLGARVFVLFCCLPVHEAAHAWMADKLGDSTGRLKGRITLNPLAHISLVGALMIFFFGFGFAKPVPVNIRNFKKRKQYFALTSLAGPVSNLLLSVLFAILYNIVYIIAAKTGNMGTGIIVAYNFFYYTAYINVALAVFNLIPIPPLDGSRLVTLFLPDNIYYKLLSYERYFIYILFGLIFLFDFIGFSPLSIISSFVFDGISWLAGLPFRLF